MGEETRQIDAEWKAMAQAIQNLPERVKDCAATLYRDLGIDPRRAEGMILFCMLEHSLIDIEYLARPAPKRIKEAFQRVEDVWIRTFEQILRTTRDWDDTEDEG